MVNMRFRMKSLSLSFIVIVFVCACNNQPEKKEVKPIVKEKKDSSKKKHDEWDILEKDKLIASVSDTAALLKKFFTPDTIIAIRAFWKNDTNKLIRIALWKPDADAKYNMNISQDGFCHTNIDTILKVPLTGKWNADAGNRAERYVVIFTTLNFADNHEMGGGHFTGANFGAAYIEREKGDTCLHAVGFQRSFVTAGNWGFPADSIALTDFGKDYALDIQSGFTQSGEYSNVQTYYAIPFFNSIFTLQQEDTYDADWYDSTQSESVIKTMQLIQNNNTYSDIKVRIENSSYDKTKRRQVTKKNTEYYTWNEEADDYEKK